MIWAVIHPSSAVISIDRLTCVIQPVHSDLLHWTIIVNQSNSLFMQFYSIECEHLTPQSNSPAK